MNAIVTDLPGSHGVGPDARSAVEWARHGILVNWVAPGWFPSEMSTRFMDTKRRPKILARMPLHRFGEPDELAAAVLFLLSPAATCVTGHDLAIDGGAGIWLLATVASTS